MDFHVCLLFHNNILASEFVSDEISKAKNNIKLIQK